MSRREMLKDMELALVNLVAREAEPEHRADVQAAVAGFFQDEVVQFSDAQLEAQFPTPEALVRRFSEYMDRKG